MDMKLRISILTILTLSTTTFYGQVIEKCDGTILLSTSERIGKLKQDEILDFLLTFGTECNSNVEYSEWSNELLFSLLYKQTELTLKTIKKEERKIEMNEILNDLNSPINDLIDIKEILVKVDKVKVNKRFKNRIIEQLKSAENKMN
jgi:hypothetical protein